MLEKFFLKPKQMKKQLTVSILGVTIFLLIRILLFKGFGLTIIFEEKQAIQLSILALSVFLYSIYKYLFIQIESASETVVKRTTAISFFLLFCTGFAEEIFYLSGLLIIIFFLNFLPAGKEIKVTVKKVCEQISKPESLYFLNIAISLQILTTEIFHKPVISAIIIYFFSSQVLAQELPVGRIVEKLIKNFSERLNTVQMIEMFKSHPLRGYKPFEENIFQRMMGKRWNEQTLNKAQRIVTTSFFGLDLLGSKIGEHPNLQIYKENQEAIQQWNKSFYIPVTAGLSFEEKCEVANRPGEYAAAVSEELKCVKAARQQLLYELTDLEGMFAEQRWETIGERVKNVADIKAKIIASPDYGKEPNVRLANYLKINQGNASIPYIHKEGFGQIMSPEDAAVKEREIIGLAEFIKEGLPLIVDQGDCTVQLPDGSAVTYEHKDLGDERIVKKAFQDMLLRLNPGNTYNADKLAKYALEIQEHNIKNFIVVFNSEERQLTTEEEELFVRVQKEWNKRLNQKVLIVWKKT